MSFVTLLQASSTKKQYQDAVTRDTLSVYKDLWKITIQIQLTSRGSKEISPHYNSIIANQHTDGSGKYRVDHKSLDIHLIFKCIFVKRLTAHPVFLWFQFLWNQSWHYLLRPTTITKPRILAPPTSLVTVFCLKCPALPAPKRMESLVEVTIMKQVIRYFPAVYTPWWLVTVLTTARELILSYTTLAEFTHSHFTSLRFTSVCHQHIVHRRTTFFTCPNALLGTFINLYACFMSHPSNLPDLSTLGWELHFSLLIFYNFP
jgi:hypothetical protein